MSAPTPTAETSVARFGTFAGVFRPIALTVLGALLYLREGWLVGNAGLVGALVVILAAASITGLTCLSLASIATNTRVQAGGAFAIIAQALGLEAGGAIGIPLWIAQSLSATLYLYAFSEAWQVLFPTHWGPAVAVVGFVGVAVLAWRSAGLALRAQAAMFVVVLGALTSSALGLFTAERLYTPVLLGHFPELSLARSFALFFPGLTGIMVGVGMSGSLRDPRRSLPRGALGAWAATLGVYVLWAFWYALIAPPDVLLDNATVMIDRALWPRLVLVGLLVSTLMAALSSLVAAPRLLAAMAGHGVLPGSGWLSRGSAAGEPRNATLVTMGVVGLGLCAGSLDAIAPIITSFFIMTYLAINLVVYVEQVLSMVSWRPTFVVPRATPLIGVGACLVGLTVGSPFGGLVEVALVVGLYAALSRRRLETPWETVRSGMLVSLGAWAARRVAHVQRSERAWKPDLLVPLSSREQGESMSPLILGLAQLTGSVRWLGLGSNPDLRPSLPLLTAKLREAGVDTSAAALETDQPQHGLSLALDTLQSALFPPNLVVVDCTRVTQSDIDAYVSQCRRLSIGLALWFPAPQGPVMGQQRNVAVWLADRSPTWELRLHLSNLDLPILAGWLLSSAWGADLRLDTVVRDPDDSDAGRAFLEGLIRQARLRGAQVRVSSGDFVESLTRAPRVDLNIFGTPPAPQQDALQALVAAADSSCLFLLDSGRESALA